MKEICRANKKRDIDQSQAAEEGIYVRELEALPRYNEFFTMWTFKVLRNT
jgi:hypothetical protein